MVRSVVEGHDSYDAMIRSLLLLADSWDDLGELVNTASDEQMDFRTRGGWLMKRCLQKILRMHVCHICDAFRESSFHGSYSVRDGGVWVFPVSGSVFDAAGSLGCASVE